MNLYFPLATDDENVTENVPVASDDIAAWVYARSGNRTDVPLGVYLIVRTPAEDDLPTRDKTFSVLGPARSYDDSADLNDGFAKAYVVDGQGRDPELEVKADLALMPPVRTTYRPAWQQVFYQLRYRLAGGGAFGSEILAEVSEQEQSKVKALLGRNA